MYCNIIMSVGPSVFYLDSVFFAPKIFASFPTYPQVNSPSTLCINHAIDSVDDK